jgi:hypothetical protein
LCKGVTRATMLPAIGLKEDVMSAKMKILGKGAF